MKRLIGTSLLFAVCASWGQATGKVSQPWTKPLASYESRVEGCTAPIPFNKVALDDWVCPKSGPILRVTWWGTLWKIDQAKRPFYIAIYKTAAAACLPNAQPDFKICVTPDYVRYVGKDCVPDTTGAALLNKVYKMSANIAIPGVPPFVQTQGTRYWIQISEIDQQSIRPGIEDFRWSAHREIKNCSAVQRNASLVINSLFNYCDQKQDDLAFELNSRGIYLSLPVLRPNSIYTAQLFKPNAADFTEEICLDPDPDGNVFFDFDAEDGTYDVIIKGEGMLSELLPAVQMGDGSVRNLSLRRIHYGEATGDDQINDFDLAEVIFNFNLKGSGR